MEKKICVYAIAKNEIKFVDRWFKSVKVADYVCVLDTGSTDGTFERLKELGVITKQKTYENFRFDVARNDSLTLVPDDAEICVCVDLDEIFEKGWNKLLKNAWKDDTCRARYRYTWNFNPDGSEGIVFMSDKIHKNKMFKWTCPVHEILTPINNQPCSFVDIPKLQLNHHADNTKSRSSYLPLLELSVKEDPLNDRNMHYLGREYMYYGEYDKAIETLNKHLALKSATWADERAASLRYIASCYGGKGDKENQEEYLIRAILENNLIREAYFDLGVLYFEEKKYLKSAFVFEEMLKIKERYLNYMSSPICWGSLPYDYLSMCYYELKNYKKAVQMVDLAISLSDEQRLKNNREIFLKLKKEAEN